MLPVQDYICVKKNQTFQDPHFQLCENPTFSGVSFQDTPFLNSGPLSQDPTFYMAWQISQKLMNQQDPFSSHISNTRIQAVYQKSPLGKEMHKKGTQKRIQKPNLQQISQQGTR